MARIRTIKPEFCQSESVGRLSRDARLLFVQLWTIADDSGKSRASSRLLASLLYPFDQDAGALIDGWLAELEAQGMIVRYEIDGAHYLVIPKWLEHQKIDHASKSRIPDFRESSRILANPRETFATDLGPRTLDLKNISKANAFSPRQSAPRGVEGQKVLEASESVPNEAQATTLAGHSNGSNVRVKVSANLGVSEQRCEDIYRQYPHRVGKRAAIRAIQGALKRIASGKENASLNTAAVDTVDIVEYLKSRVCAYACSPAGQNPDRSKIPHPATWFNQSRYLDDDQAWQYVIGEEERWRGRQDPNVGIFRPK